MAATDATPLPIKNQAFLFSFPINDSNGNPVTGAASLDSERSLDDAAFADCTNEATEVGNGWYTLLLTAAEMNTSNTKVAVKSDKQTTMIAITPLDTSELTAVPAANASPWAMINWLFMGLRNARASTAAAATVANDAGTAIGTATVSDDGTNYSRGKHV